MNRFNLSEIKYSKLTYWGLLAMAMGIFTSVSLPSIYHIFIFIPGVVIFFRMFREKTLALPVSAFLLILLIIWAQISNIINYEDLHNASRSFGKPKYWVFAILSIPLLQISFRNYIDERRIRILLNVFLFSIVLAALYGVVKGVFLHPGVVSRVGGLTGIMRYGYGMSLVLIIMLGVLLRFSLLSHLFNKKLFFTALILGAAGFLLSQTRGAMLGFIISLPLVLYLYKKKWGYIASALTLVIVFGVVTASLTGVNTSIRLLERVESYSNLKRLSQYETAFKTSLDNPFFGVGVNNFSSLCPELKEKYGIKFQEYCFKIPYLKCEFHKHKPLKPYCAHAHNIILETTANMGIVAGIILILWLFFWFIELYKMKTLYSIIMMPVIINIFIEGQFENIFDANNSFMIFMLYSLSFVGWKKDVKMSEDKLTGMRV